MDLFHNDVKRSLQDDTQNLIGSAIMKVVLKPIKFRLTSRLPRLRRHYEKGPLWPFSCSVFPQFVGTSSFKFICTCMYNHGKFTLTYNFEKSLFAFLPPPGGYVIILVCMCVCVCVCVYVCLSVNTITQKIINILTPNFAHTFAIA